MTGVLEIKKTKQNKTNYFRARFHVSVSERKLTPLIHMKACRVAWGFDTNIWESSLCLCWRTPPRNDHGDTYHLLLFQHSSVSSSFQMGIMEKMCDDPHLKVLLKWWRPLKSKKQNKTNYLKARFHVSVSERKLTPLIHIKACRVAWGFDTNVWESSLCLCSRTPPKNDHGDTYHLLLFQHSSVSSSFQMGITEKMCGEPHSNAIIWTMGYVLQTHIATSYPMLNYFAFQLYIV